MSAGDIWTGPDGSKWVECDSQTRTPEEGIGVILPTADQMLMPGDRLVHLRLTGQ